MHQHRGHSADTGRARSHRSDSGLERGVRVRPGALHAGHAARRALGLEAFRQRVKIYATDLDDDALTEARAASYEARAIESVPQELLTRYFEYTSGRYVIHKDLRRAVIFGRNDLVKDAPSSHVDLLVCRNTLMYFNADTQRNVLGRLQFALVPKGALFLGHAEMLLSHSDRFSALDLKNRIFRKSVGPRGGVDRYDPTAAFYERQGESPGLSSVREAAFRASPVAQIVVTGEDTVAMINQQAETVFGLSARDIGRLLRDLEMSYRPVELRTYLEQAKVERRSARIPDVNGNGPAPTPCGSRSTSILLSTPRTACSGSR
jgi:two-component system, chemotaxis family, CheB/CheR fusion protein